MKIIYNLIGNICMHWWTFWSNKRFKNAIRTNKGVKDEDRVNDLASIKKLVGKLYYKFEWTRDGIDQLWDAITPPPQNYEHYLHGILKDDCDGFHALVYHCLQNSGIECYLLTANMIGSGHCILLFRIDGKWHINDYINVYEEYNTAREAINEYNKIYPTKYKHKGKVLFNGLVGYDYTTEKFYVSNIKKLK